MKNSTVSFRHISVHEGPEKSPGYLLWHISTAWRKTIESTLKQFGLTHPQFVMLAALAWLTRNGDQVIQATVGKMAGLDPNTTSQIIKGLETKKLIKQIQSIDSRAKNYILTNNGSQLLFKALPEVEKADAQFFKTLNKQELESLVTLFQKIMSHH